MQKALSTRQRHHRSLKRIWPFIIQNRQVLFYILLIIIGAILGCKAFSMITTPEKEQFLSFMHSNTPSNSFSEIVTATVSAALIVWVLLMALFLIGMTPYGAPVILIILLFFGFYFGVNECCVFEKGGLPTVAIQVIPFFAINASAVIISSVQAMHLSSLFSRQLLPFFAHCGSLWQDFKRYLLYNLLSVLLVLTSSAYDVAIHMFF